MLDIIRQGHEQLVVLLLQEGRSSDGVKEQVAQEFSVCNPTTAFQDPKNIGMFLGEGVMYFGTQTIDPTCTRDVCNIEKKCEALVEGANANGLTPVEISRRWFSTTGPRSDKKSVTTLTGTSILKHLRIRRRLYRSWWWQTCTEFRFYATCELDSECPFGRGTDTVEDSLEVCQKAFDIGPNTVASAVQDILVYYGGWDLASSRILSVNGDVDPWSTLAIEGHGLDDETLPSFVVPGASHHFWTNPSRPTDSPAVVVARGNNVRNRHSVVGR